VDIILTVDLVAAKLFAAAKPALAITALHARSFIIAYRRPVRNKDSLLE
jgi:hypothetical protein